VNTAVDSNVLLDLVSPDSLWLQESRAAVDFVIQEGDVVICEAVVAEVSAHLSLERNPIAYLQEMGITLEPSSMNALRRAGRAWVDYSRTRSIGLQCQACGAETIARCSHCETTISVRQRVLPDFMIGAHALEHADRLLTRDKAIYRRYFPDLELV